MNHPHRLLVLVVAALCASGCYSIRTNASPNGATQFASSNELCVPVSTRRVHYALVGLVPINNNEISVPPNARVRVVTQASGLDVFLRALGAVFTLGLYGGSQSAVVEVCGAIVEPSFHARLQR